jgi:hypothetical protein
MSADGASICSSCVGLTPIKIDRIGAVWSEARLAHGKTPASLLGPHACLSPFSKPLARRVEGRTWSPWHVSRWRLLHVMAAAPGLSGVPDRRTMSPCAICSREGVEELFV